MCVCAWLCGGGVGVCMWGCVHACMCECVCIVCVCARLAAHKVEKLIINKYINDK